MSDCERAKSALLGAADGPERPCWRGFPHFAPAARKVSKRVGLLLDLSGQVQGEREYGRAMAIPEADAPVPDPFRFRGGDAPPCALARCGCTLSGVGPELIRTGESRPITWRKK